LTKTDNKRVERSPAYFKIYSRFVFPKIRRRTYWVTKVVELGDAAANLKPLDAVRAHDVAKRKQWPIEEGLSAATA
jgi:hypothetical protein